ncbi:MAG: hypothetical protein JW953_14535, partial [Anaerolineae bacterium]|nr:hypothetical protein [Anaerolineae bacterium]
MTVAVNPANPLEILAVLKDKGIYKTDNGGIDWKQVSDDGSAVTLHFATADPNVVYAGVYGYILRSDDGGDTWTPWQINVG